MEVVRKIIFYIFVAVYAVLCPALILYSLGYIVYPLKEKLVHTGVVHFSSWPQGAQIFIEKSRYQERTPATIRDLLPGPYTVTLTHAHYRPWTHQVFIEDGKAAVFEKILLVPYEWNMKKISQEAFGDLMPLAGTDYFLLSKDGQLQDLYVYDGKKEALHPFLAPGSSFADFRVASFFSREDSPALVLLGGPLWDRKYLYARIMPEGAQIMDISKLIAQRPLEMDWEPSSHDSIFALHEGYVDRLDTTTAALYPKYIEGLRGWGFGRDQVFVIDQNNAVLASPAGKKEFKAVFDGRGLPDIFAREKDFYQIRPLTGDTAVFLGARSAIVLGRLQASFINEQVLGEQYDPDKGRVLLWTRRAIGIIDLAGEQQEASLGPMAMKVRWFFELGKDIRQCFWAYEGTHVLFRDGNKVFMAAPVPQGFAHVDLVTAVKDNSSVAYVQGKDILYYLGENDGKLYALDIMSKKGEQ